MNRSSAVSAPAAVPEVLLAASEHVPRTERFAKQVTYVVLALPLAMAYWILILAEVALTVTVTAWVGLPLLLASSGLVWRGAAVERRLANRLLDARISPLPPLPGGRSGSVWLRLRRRLRSRPFWRAAALLGVKLPVTVLGAAILVLGLGLTGALLLYGVRGITEAGLGYVGPFSLGPALGVVLCLLSVPVAIVTIALTDAMASGMRALVRSLLVTSLPAGAPVRETLARSLGDRTLSIAYWLPEREEFVDERGLPVPLPEPGSERAWTAVDYDGRRVAAIIHDASLDATPELVQAAAAAASLALDNEQLKADLRARVEELRASRVRIVEASNSARRRIERDLHDGAQQQLVAMAVELRLLRNRVGGNVEALELLDRLEAKLGAALGDLRELARGIHPGILTDRGLAPALESLAERAPQPVACEVELDSRPPPSVEAVAYFVIAEALTNVIKYAQADHVTIRARYDRGDLVVELQDDGVGGADESHGTGLQGLHDRVGALDGSIVVDSPPGVGTVVRARIPCGVRSPVAPPRARPSRPDARIP